jgi:thioredoxin 1
MSDYIVAATDESFEEEVIKATKPVLVDFWAEWCGPCRAIAPVLDEVAEEHLESLKIVKVNIDDNIETAHKFAIRSIPTLLLFKDGNLIDKTQGSKTKGQLLEFLKDYLD